MQQQHMRYRAPQTLQKHPKKLNAALALHACSIIWPEHDLIGE
jgi:hypothetical protein